MVSVDVKPKVSKLLRSHLYPRNIILIRLRTCLSHYRLELSNNVPYRLFKLCEVLASPLKRTVRLNSTKCISVNVFLLSHGWHRTVHDSKMPPFVAYMCSAWLMACLFCIFLSVHVSVLISLHSPSYFINNPPPTRKSVINKQSLYSQRDLCGSLMHLTQLRSLQRLFIHLGFFFFLFFFFPLVL